jgi:hypothetical protein
VKVAVGDPGVEICGNGIDEDGNGSDLPCPPGTEICGNGIDEDGNGSDLPCPPGTEICGNGTDDDGDGFIDENCPGGPSCSDGIRNQNETGVDTGGVCGNGSNGTCFDGIKNQNETDIDYGGVCGIPGTCFDGIKNQNETGVDTGGVCTTDPDTQICSNISNEFLALLTPPITDVSELSLHHYRKLANGRCACQTGYILNAELMCVRPTYQEK